MSDEQPKIFFIHIQKTAGGTLRQTIRSNLPKGAIYPEGSGFDHDPLDAYWTIPRLLSISPERQAQIRGYIGHFPYIVTELLDTELVTMSVLRDPVERTISYLKMRSGDPERQGRTVEEIYDDPFDFPCFIQNHQTKIFAMTADDKLETFMDVIDVDRDRLEIAKAHLQNVDILGLQSCYDEMLAVVADRFGWQVGHVENTHVSQGEWEISDALRARIAEDNALDIEFYEFAEQLYRERHRSPAVT